MVEFGKEYELLKKEYKLPDIALVLKIVDLDASEEVSDPLKEMTHKILDKIEEVQKIIEIILQPDAKFTDLNECKEFNDSDKIKLTETYRKTMVLKRTGMISLIESSETSKIDFIKLFFSEWPEIKEVAIMTLNKMKDSWIKESKFDMEVGYLG